MAAARAGHATAAAKFPDGDGAILFGGLPAGVTGAPVAERIVGQSFVAYDVGAQENRTGATATTMPNGDVLVLGGKTAAGAQASGLVITPTVPATVAPLPTALSVARAGHTASLTGNDLVVCGGADATGAVQPSCDVLDATTYGLKSTVPLATARTGHSSETMETGIVVLAGGFGSRRRAAGARWRSTLRSECRSCPTSRSTSSASPIACVGHTLEQVRVWPARSCCARSSRRFGDVAGKRVVGDGAPRQAHRLRARGRAVPRPAPDGRGPAQVEARRGEDPGQGRARRVRFLVGDAAPARRRHRRSARRCTWCAGGRRSPSTIAAGSSCSTPTAAQFAAALRAREPHAQAHADRSAPLQRHRQRLLRRDPASRQALAGGADAEARRRRDRAAVRGDPRRARRVDRSAARRSR